MYPSDLGLLLSDILLTDEQDQAIEYLQAGELWCIFGYSSSYARMRVLAEVSTLSQRQIAASDTFAKKCLGMSRFAKWFPPRPVTRRAMRGGKAFMEEHARCNWLLNTPMFFMRRRLNGKEGKRYGKRNKEYRNEEYASCLFVCLFVSLFKSQ